ncbi:MAG: hypothetical protein COB02_04810 [Candidatus Cloacimonadota bacterium]|nr:MAG: hypothetical protein COB02_04810 [Candidatus Cloacimonadota bacterium]
MKSLSFILFISILSFANIGCFSKKEVKKPIDIQITDEIDDSDEETYETKEFKLEDTQKTGFRTFEEKWDDFKYKTSYRSKDEMVFFAENIFQQLPAKDIERKMQISFYLMEAFQKRKDNENAKKYADHYKTFFQLKTGGKAFQKHQSMIEFKEKLTENWSISEE